MKRPLLWIFLFFLVIRVSGQSNVELATAPPMGWNSWNWFGKYGINEDNIRECMDAIVDEGLLEAGYSYFVIDGGWRDTILAKDGRLQANPVRFPNGIKPLADYAHSRGLKFGLHTVPGTHDCGGDKVGGLGNEEVQIGQFIDWGLDFIKLDKCRLKGEWTWDEDNLFQTYKKWRNLLDHSGREIVLSISAYTWRDWYPDIGQMARTTGDIRARVSGGAVFNGDPRSVMGIANENNKWAGYAGKGYWNDPDMLALGSQGLSLEEQKVHFALWCIMSSPLILGNDPRNMTEGEKAIITNALAISVNQDQSGQGTRIFKEDNIGIWSKGLTHGEVAVLLINSGEEQEAGINLSLSDLGFIGKASVQDIFSGERLSLKDECISRKIPPHSGLFLMITPE